MGAEEPAEQGTVFVGRPWPEFLECPPLRSSAGVAAVVAARWASEAVHPEVFPSPLLPNLSPHPTFRRMSF